MVNKWNLYVNISVILFVSIVSISTVRMCDKNVKGNVEKIVGLSENHIQESFFKRTVTISPSNINNAGHDSSGPVQKGNDKGNSAIQSISLDELPTRPSNIVWIPVTGQIRYSRYGFAFGPGISIQTKGKHTGVGIDVRGFYVGDFGAQVGFALYKEEKITPQISIGYNLRRTHYLSNTDLIVGIDWNKTIFGGLRVELGAK